MSRTMPTPVAVESHADCHVEILVERNVAEHANDATDASGANVA